MKLKTRNFGEIEFEESGLFHFEDGIPGFEALKKYILIDGGDGLFTFMQSIEDGDICLTMIEPLHYINDYEVDVPDEALQNLGELGPENLKMFSVLVVPEEAEKMTTNLKAPIIINTHNKKGKQFTLTTDKWSLKYPIYEAMKAYAENGGAKAC